MSTEPRVGAVSLVRRVSTVATASTAPAAPRRWPIVDFVELTGIAFARSSPNARLRARVSTASLS